MAPVVTRTVIVMARVVTRTGVATDPGVTPRAAITHARTTAAVTAVATTNATGGVATGRDAMKTGRATIMVRARIQHASLFAD